jgi:hypothetical protein
MTEPKFYIDLYELGVGDHFVEDEYPGVYRVDDVFEAVRCRTNVKVVETTDITNNTSHIEWFYADRVYAPNIYRVKTNDK